MKMKNHFREKTKSELELDLKNIIEKLGDAIEREDVDGMVTQLFKLCIKTGTNKPLLLNLMRECKVDIYPNQLPIQPRSLEEYLKAPCTSIDIGPVSDLNKLKANLDAALKLFSEGRYDYPEGVL